MVLWRENPRRGRLVVACCHTASKRGVRVSMKLAEAAELVRSTVGSRSMHSGPLRDRPLIQRHDRDLDHHTLEQIAVSVQRKITPKVALEEIGEKPWAGHPRHQCESLLCDIAGVSHLFGGETGLLIAVKELLAQHHLQARMAVADSLAAAWALAHEAKVQTWSQLGQESVCQESEVTCAVEKSNDSLPVFHGGLIVCDGEEASRLIGNLPVQGLRLPAETVSTLARLGVGSVRQLLALPRGGLATRLGRDLVLRLEQVKAEVDEPLKVHQAEPEYVVDLTLQYPTNDQEILMDRIKRLTLKLTSQLLLRQRGALRLSCCLRLTDGKTKSLDVGLFAPTVDDVHLSGLVTRQLESIHAQEKVERLSLMVTLSGELRSSQSSLFGLDEHQMSATGMTDLAISRLIDALSGRVGRDRVGYLELQDDPLPERAFDVRPLTGNVISSVRKKKQRKRKQEERSRNACGVGASIEYSLVMPSVGDALRRPLSLLTEPVPLRVAWGKTGFQLRVSSPRLPDSIRFNGEDHRVMKHWGPERVESGWWRGKSIRRDYYRIETDQGQWWWIFRNLTTREERQQTRTPYRWMLHGRFS